MSHQKKLPDDPKLLERLARLEKHDYRVEHIFRRILHNIERVIAAITLIILVAAFLIHEVRNGNHAGIFQNCPVIIHGMAGDINTGGLLLHGPEIRSVELFQLRNGNCRRSIILFQHGK